MSGTANRASALLKKWMQVGWMRVGAVVALIFLCLLFVLWFLRPWLDARESAQLDTQLDLVPSPLPDNDAASLNPKPIERFGTSFQVPWGQIVAEKNEKDFTVLNFKNGLTVMFFNPYSNLTHKDPHEQARLRAVFGEKALSSNYNWEESVLEATPDQLQWWNRSRNRRMAVLLGLKATDLNFATAIYSVANKDLRGFQIGDAGMPSGQIRIKLYDANGRPYEFFMTNGNSASAAATQADINAFVASIHPIPHR